MPLPKQAPPDPEPARGLDDLAEGLRRLKAWAGGPSFEAITDRVNAARGGGEQVSKSTVAYCFRSGRRRFDTDLVLAVVRALHPDEAYVGRWRWALRSVSGEIEAVSQVRVRDKLPPDLMGFTGRDHELDRLHDALEQATGSAGPVVISAIEGMAGVGKTQLAIHAGHQLHRRQPFERVLFVNLRGFDPDPAQPPADPAAVLDGFLRLLGQSGQVPHGLEARTAAYRERLTGVRALVVLDNAATVEQVRPLLPATPGCLTVVTSRRSLTGLDSATHLAVDVFTPDEALAFLAHAVPGVPAGADPGAAARIAHRCGYLPLALGLVAGHIAGTPDWTLTDHAERLDERHRLRRLDTGVELALDLSYQHLPADRRRLLRLLALHPGQDFDPYATAALTGTDLDTARVSLRHLRQDHLVQPAGEERYTFHDLVRAYSAVMAAEEERPAERRDALTQLFDHYLATAAAAMDVLYSAETYLRPRIDRDGHHVPDLSDPDDARRWLDTERPTLIAVAAFTAANGWESHTTRMSRVLFRYFDGGHHTDGLTVHGHALQAASRSGDAAGRAHALTDLGVTHIHLGRNDAARDHLHRAAELFEQLGDLAGLARTQNNLGMAAESSGDFPAATVHYQRARDLHRQVGNRTGEAGTLRNLGNVAGQSGRYDAATEHFTQALALTRQIGHRVGEAGALNGLGEVDMRSGRYEQAQDHLEQCLALFRQLGNRLGEADTLESLGRLHTRLGRPEQAEQCYQRVLTICRESGYRLGEAGALNGLGEAAQATGRSAAAAELHTAAGAVAVAAGALDQSARAHAGLGHAHRALGDPARAREHYEQALAVFTGLGMPEADEIRAHLG